MFRLRVRVRVRVGVRRRMLSAYILATVASASWMEVR